MKEQFIHPNDFVDTLLDELCCPQCQKAFPKINHKRKLSCSCGAIFPIKEGIIQFFPYEEKSGYTEKQINHLKDIEKNHFWFKARRLFIFSLLKRFLKYSEGLVLDVGCGTGQSLLEINKQGFRGIGIDLQSIAFNHVEMATSSLRFYQASARKLPFKNKHFDAIVLADVLEHMEEGVLSELDRVLSPSAVVIITVPAYQCLWGSRDENAGHLRRYRKKDLKEIAEKYSWKIEFLSGYQFFLFPLVYLMRRLKLSQKTEEKIIPGINTILYWINTLEIKSRISWPWGTSLIGVMRKNEF